MKKTILLLMVLLISFLAYINCEPRVAVASTPWTIKQMTKNDVEDTLGTWQSISRDGRRIVFDRRPSQWGPEGYGVDWDVYTMNIWNTPGEERQMTTAWGEDVEAGISYDGSMIAFASGRFHIGEPWDLEIFAMNFTDNPGQEVQVSDNSAYLDGAVRISGDGKIIAWHSGPDTPLKHAEYITIADISDASHIAYAIIDTPEWDSDPTLSLDGTKVCFRQFTDQINLGVFIANTDGTGITRIPGALGQGVISGDGSKVAVSYNDGDWEFSVVDVATGNTLFRTDNSVYDTFGSFDRDGNVIAYSRAGDIYICDLRTMQETRLTYDDYEDYSPRLDGDGDTIAFVSMGRDGPDAEIFVLMQAHAPRLVDFFLHGGASLDNDSPTAVTAKYKDSPSIKFGGGNPWKEIGIWTGSASLTDGRLEALSGLDVWLGLKNSDDQGTNFDLRAEVYKDGVLVASGEAYLIKGVTRNPDKAMKVTVSFGSFSPVDFDGISDTLSLKILTRIGTDGNGNFGGGHSSAVGLRLYFDAVSRPAMLAASIA